MSKYEKKVCILTTVHSPFDTRIFYKQANSLRESGYDVTIIAKHQKDETIDCVKIKPLSQAKNRLSRIFGLSSKALFLSLRQKYDIYHFHDPELIPVGIILRLLGKKVVYDVHEDVPQQILTKYWIPIYARSIVSRVFNFIEKISSRSFSAVVTATPPISDKFYKYNGSTITVQNYPKLNELNSVNEFKPFKERDKVVAYIGGITKLRGIYEMVEAVRQVSFSIYVRLILGGNFNPSTLESEIKEKPGWEFVDYKGWLNREQVANVLGTVRVGLVLIHPDSRYQVSYPVKMFEYMSAGLPVIASNFYLWKEIVEGNNCGLTVDPLNPEEIAQAIQYLLDRPELCEEMGRNGRKAVEQKYNWEKEKEKLLELYNKLLN